MAIKFADTARPNNSANTTTKGTFPVAIASDIWFNDGDSLEEKWADMAANDTAVQVTELPTATEALDGVVYQYIGDTTDDYTNGYFYQCTIVDNGSGGTTYGWKEKEVQGGTLTVSTENGNQLQQLDDGLYVHIDDWLVDVEQLPTGDKIDDVMYRSTMGEPDIEVHYEMTSQEIRQMFEDNGFTLKSKYTTATGFAYNYIAPAGSSIQCGVKRTQNGAIVWRSFDHFEISVASDANETPQQIAAYSNTDLISETAYIRSEDSSKRFGWKCWFRDLNNVTNEYLYIGNSTKQTTKRIALYDELPSSVEVSEQDGNQIQVLSDGIYVGESISSVDCIAVSAIADAEDWDEALYYYDISDGKIYQFKEGSAVEVDAVPDEIEITKELYATLSDDQKNLDVTWFVNDMENPFDQVDLTSAVVQELQEHHTDVTPTSGSANYVTSNGIANAIDLIKSELMASFIPRSSGYWSIANNVGTLESDKTYTANHDGLLIVYFLKKYSGNTIRLFVNGDSVNQLPNYQGDMDATISASLIAHVRNGDSIRITCDGNGSYYYIQQVIIQKIDWFKT